MKSVYDSLILSTEVRLDSDYPIFKKFPETGNIKIKEEKGEEIGSVLEGCPSVLYFLLR